MGTQHVPQRVGRADRALAEAVSDGVHRLSVLVIKTRIILYHNTHLIIAPLAVEELVVR